jgi:hypothetical protein
LAKIVSVTRILNEDDIVEAFVRHNAVHADHMLFLDDSSIDRTLEILQTLQVEGFPLTVFQNFAECLALQHGQLIDEVVPALVLVDSWNAKQDFLF